MPLPLCACLLLAASPSAQACSLVLSTNGTMTLSGDATRLGTQEGLGGSAATVTVASTLLAGAFDLTVSAPTWVEYPTSFNTGSAQLEVAFSGTMTSGYTSGSTTQHFPATLLSASILTIHSRITSGNFYQGTYRTKTVVTCS